MMANFAVATNELEMTRSSIESFLKHEKDNGASADCLRQRMTHVTGLYQWLPNDKLITAVSLQNWRKALVENGYSQATVSNYVKSVNRYLDYSGHSALRFNQGRAKDLSGKEYGYLTAIENTGKKNRNDYIWRCRCRCGKEVFLPATRLLTGNTSSCGCLHSVHLQKANKYMDKTSIRMSMEEKVHNANSVSGYTGVAPKRDKWQAYITYKGKRYSLGCYTELEDAVKARARAKEQVKENAEALLVVYEAQHKDASV